MSLIPKIGSLVVEICVYPSDCLFELHDYFKDSTNTETPKCLYYTYQLFTGNFALLNILILQCSNQNNTSNG